MGQGFGHVSVCMCVCAVAKAVGDKAEKRKERSASRPPDILYMNYMNTRHQIKPAREAYRAGRAFLSTGHRSIKFKQEMKQAEYSHFTSEGLGLVQCSARGLRRWFPIVVAGADIRMLGHQQNTTH